MKSLSFRTDLLKLVICYYALMEKLSTFQTPHTHPFSLSALSPCPSNNKCCISPYLVFCCVLLQRTKDGFSVAHSLSLSVPFEI